MGSKVKKTEKKKPDDANASEEIVLNSQGDAFAQITHPQKRAMLQTLEKALGVVTTACNVVGISRRSHYHWMETDPEYRRLVKAIDDVVIDFAESHLHKRIKDGDTIATIFFLKTKGKKRGYVERTEITGKDGEPLRAFSWDELFAAARRNTDGNAETNNG
jgi:hypothetical protein